MRSKVLLGRKHSTLIYTIDCSNYSAFSQTRTLTKVSKVRKTLHICVERTLNSYLSQRCRGFVVKQPQTIKARKWGYESISDTQFISLLPIKFPPFLTVSHNWCHMKTCLGCLSVVYMGQQ